MPLIEALTTTEPLAQLFSDSSVLQAMLDFEVALARVEARFNVIPQAAATAIASASDARAFDVDSLARDSRRSGTIVIPFVKRLTELVGKQDADAADYVHWGATSQDVSDSAMVLLLKRAVPTITADLSRLELALAKLSEQHAVSVMLGRTLMQPAPPVTFGLKAAGWLAAVRRCRLRLGQASAEALVLQFGGAVGTLAALGDRGPAVAQAVADELGLKLPDAPWHTHRDRLANFVCACGILVASLGKSARDISLLSQSEVAEAAEPSGEGRGGSSSMPQKKNPVGCAIALAAATRVPGLVAAYLSGAIQEHERGLGGSQSEWPIIVEIVQATGSGAAAMAEVAEGLVVDPERMQKNLEATLGTTFAEKAAVQLRPKLGRDRAQKLIEKATRLALQQHKSLAETLREIPEAKQNLDEAFLKSLDRPKDYLGSAELFRQQLLGKSAKKD